MREKSGAKKSDAVAELVSVAATVADGFLPALPGNFQGIFTSGTGQLSEESLKKVAENYIQYYAAGESHTARAKRYDLQHFLEFIAGSPHQIERVLVSDWTLQVTQNFVDYRLSLGETPATVSRRLATIKHFGRTLAERVHGYINPAREVKGPVLQTSRPHGLTQEEIELLREAALLGETSSTRSFNAIRNRFLLELLLATGLRADEVRLLVMAQVSEDLSWLKNVKTKGRKFRNVYLDTHIREHFRDYIQSREVELQDKFPLLSKIEKSLAGKFPVLISTYRADIGRPLSFGLSPKTVWRIIADFGKKAQALSTKQMTNLHPHKLRHTFAHGLLDSSKDVRLVAQALGHSDVRTTMRYTERTDEELAKAIEKKIAEI